MQKVIHRAGERGVRDHGWLKTFYSFSFADWYDSSRVGFGALRVLNDDLIAPSSGFGMHGHRDMEIVTIVTRGAVTHTDSLGNIKTVRAGEVQVMSAGTGVVHSESNDSSDETLALFQIWITPKEQNVTPRYTQKSFPPVLGEQAGLTLLVSPDGAEGSLSINQDAWLYSVHIDPTHPMRYSLASTERLTSSTHGLYIFVIEGSIEVEGDTIGARDAVGVWDTKEVVLTAVSPTTAILIEVPMK